MRLFLAISTLFLFFMIHLSAFAQVGADPDPAFANCKDEPGASAACNKAMRENCEAIAQCNSDPNPSVCAQSVKQVDTSMCGDFSTGSTPVAPTGTPIEPPPTSPPPTTPPTPPATPPPSPNPTTPQPQPPPPATPPSSADASDDVNSCINDTNAAINACNVSQSTQFQSQVANQPTGGYGQMNSAQQINNVVNGCSNMQSKCLGTCGNSLQDAQAKCNGKCSSLLNQQIGQINSYYTGCQNLSSNLSTLQNAGNQALNQAAQQQQQNDGMTPSSTNDNSSSPAPQPQAMATPSSNVDCTNPVNAGQCAVQTSQAAVKGTVGNSAGMQDSNPATVPAQKGSGFNVGDPGTQTQNPNFPNSNSSLSQPQQPMMPYAGGSSSGFTVGGDSGNQRSSSLVNGRRMTSVSGKISTDILHGAQSVSGYSSTVSRSLSSVSGRSGMRSIGFGGLVGSRNGDLRHFYGLDLKQYLPGGLRDGTRRLSGVNFAHPDIHSKNDDIWADVSNRFRIHCKLQLLYDFR